MVNTALITGSYGGQGDFAREHTMGQDMSMITVNVGPHAHAQAIPTRHDLLRFQQGSQRQLHRRRDARPPLQAVYYATKSYIKPFL